MIVEVEIDLDDIDEDYFVDFLRRKGYRVSKDGVTPIHVFTNDELEWLEEYIVQNNLDDCNMLVKSILQKVRFG